MKIKLHHIAIAVKDLAASGSVLERILDTKFTEPEYVDSQKVLVSYAENIELVQATQENSPLFAMIPHPIKSFIKKKGEGLHHLCFEVNNLDSALIDLKAKGIEPITSEPMIGSCGNKIVFLNPHHCNEILIELKEKKY